MPEVDLYFQLNTKSYCQIHQILSKIRQILFRYFSPFDLYLKRNQASPRSMYCQRVKTKHMTDKLCMPAYYNAGAPVLLGVAGAAGAAVLATKDSKAGEVARSAGAATNAAIQKTKQINKEHQLTTKVIFLFFGPCTHTHTHTHTQSNTHGQRRPKPRLTELGRRPRRSTRSTK